MMNTVVNLDLFPLSRRVARWLFFMVACLLLVTLDSLSLAADQTVTNINDSGTGSLPNAVGAVGIGENVIFQSGIVGQTITLSSNLDVTRSMNFINNTGGAITVDLDVNQITVATGSTTAFNSGITVTAATVAASTDAQTIYGSGNYTISDLSSDISASTTGDLAWAYGVSSWDELTIGDLSGSITANTIGDDSYAHGLTGMTLIKVTGNLSGDISATTGGDASHAFGVFSSGLDITGELSSNISASVSGTGSPCAYGLFVLGDASIASHLSGSISASSTSNSSQAFGVYSTGDFLIAGDLMGSITATANSTESSAYGIRSGGIISGGDSSTPMVITGSVQANGRSGATAIDGNQINLKLDFMGTLSAISSEGSANAIQASGTNINRVELVAGCTIVGDIYLGDGTNDTLTLSGTTGSTTYSGYIMGVETLNATGGTWALSGGISGNAALNLSGGTLTLTGSNGYTGGTTVSAGALIGNASSLQGDIINNATVEFNQGTYGSYAGTISGTGSLTKTGTATLTLTGTNSYSGGTTVSAGTLVGNSASLQGDIVNNAAVEFDQSVVGTYAGTISGTGSLTKTGSGSLTLTGSNTYGGGTTVSAGTLIGNTASLQGDIVNNATIEFDQNVAGTYAGIISGAGSLVKSGTGTLILSGNQAYTGDTVINAGSLNFNGYSTSAFIINQGAQFNGNGIVAKLDNFGIVSPGNSIGTIVVTGDYTQNGGSFLEIEINAAGASDQVNASGEAHINGGIVEVKAEAGTYTEGTTYTFLNAAGGVTGTFDAIFNNLPGFETILIYNANDIQFYLSQTHLITEAYTFNQRAITVYLDAHTAGASGDFLTVLTEVDSLSGDDARAAFESMDGELYGSLSSVGIENTDRLLRTIAMNLRSRTLLSERTEFTARGQNSRRWLSPMSSNWNSWTEGYGVGAHITGDTNTSSLDYSVGGMVVGLERWISGNTLLGFVGGYSQTTTRLNDRSDQATINSGQFGTYLHHTKENYYASGIATYGGNGYDSQRQVTIGSLTRRAQADYSGNDFALYCEMGTRYRGRRTYLQPYAALQYIQVHQNGFTESGANSVNLSVGGVQADSFRSLLGTRLVGDFLTRRGHQLSLEGRLLWRHEFLDGAEVLDARFAGQPGGTFVVKGVSVNRDAVILGGGLSFRLSNRTNLYFNYDLLTSENYTAHAGTGGLLLAW